jgi:hypothetical protein
MDARQREAFLATPRLGILMLGASPAPIGVPIWFEWAGSSIEMFSMNTAPKVQRIRQNPNISVLAANAVGETEAWVAFDGAIAITDPGGIELADRLAHRYWDMKAKANQDVMEGWQQNSQAMCQLTLTPNRIRSG